MKLSEAMEACSLPDLRRGWIKFQAGIPICLCPLAAAFLTIHPELVTDQDIRDYLTKQFGNNVFDLIQRDLAKYNWGYQFPITFESAESHTLNHITNINTILDWIITAVDYSGSDRNYVISKLKELGL